MGAADFPFSASFIFHPAPRRRRRRAGGASEEYGLRARGEKGFYCQASAAFNRRPRRRRHSLRVAGRGKHAHTGAQEQEPWSQGSRTGSKLLILAGPAARRLTGKESRLILRVVLTVRCSFSRCNTVRKSSQCCIAAVH